MSELIARCRSAWRAPGAVPWQAGQDQSATGLCLHRNRTGNPYAFPVAVAAFPLLPVSLWNSGRQLRAVADALGVEALSGWRTLLVPGAPEEAAGWLLGLAWFLPVLLVLLASVVVLETAFSAIRRRQVGTDWFLAPWLFALLLPAGIGLLQAVFAMTLGLVIGRLILGGPGKQIVSPVLLAAVFLDSAYPGSFDPILSLGDAGAISSAWGVLSTGGALAAEAGGVSLPEVFLGMESSPVGATSAALCLVSAIFLVGMKVISWRIVAGGLLGVAVATRVLAQSALGDPVLDIAWYWHASVGGFAFALVFLAADPGSLPLTPAGRWFLGLASGTLTVLIRVLDPGHPDGVFLAVLLAALFAPLADASSVYRAMRRRSRREARWP